LDYLARILERKGRENLRRAAHSRALAQFTEAHTIDSSRRENALAALRRPEGAPPRVIAEVKFASPSAGIIRAKTARAGIELGLAYEAGGAAAVSVLADYPGFRGSPLEVRRVASAVHVPVLFKEFVLEEAQLDLARAMGASMVLLLVRALSPERLATMIRATRWLGLEPVVEAADARELDVALGTDATILGVNARDLRTFTLDVDAAARAVETIPKDRISVFMSGIRSDEDFRAIARTRADAVLVGEGLAREADPAASLRRWLEVK
jgi:indole-3-glycerol phosphate synthase